MRHIIPISGKDSCATAIAQMTHRPQLTYELFFTDVGCELPETYAWLQCVEEKLDRPITKVGKSLEEIIFKYGILPSPHVRFCTREAKIEPMEKYIGSNAATIYFGIRADEDRVGYVSTKTNIIPRYPLREMGLRLQDVYTILDRYDLRPPRFFWQAAYNRVWHYLDKKQRRSFPGFVASADEQLAKLPQWAFDTLFAWRSRSNCYFCFFQRQYEWVGLLEHHPKLFERAEELERQIGNDEQKKPYTWNRDYSLADIRKYKERILAKRVHQILKMIGNRKLVEDSDDLLAVTSCGLLCGK